jgi:hypothetical protein
MVDGLVELRAVKDGLGEQVDGQAELRATREGLVRDGSIV